jgi:hypothetical protein
MKFGAYLLPIAIICSVGGVNPAAANPLPPTDVREYCSVPAGMQERLHNIPDSLLRALSVAESGRRDARSRQLVAWPWTVMAEGEGRYFPTKNEAVAAVRELQLRGIRNVDVGCMQVNLMHHGDAFESIEAALEPEINVAYGARYLAALHRETGSWFTAVKRYHSAKPKFHMPYRGRVFRIWRDIKARQLVQQAARPTAEFNLREDSESLSVDVDVVAAKIANLNIPVIPVDRSTLWRYAFDQAHGALSAYDARQSAAGSRR